MKFLNRN